MTKLADRLGDDRATRVIAVAGGRRLAVPSRLTNDSPPQAMSATFGRELAIALIIHFGGELIYIPRGPRSGPVSIADVVRLTKRGKSAAQIARKLHCSDRAVHKRRAEARDKGMLR